mmetsp:Transcript_40460/g.91912  ORF Transcript_40460/g.91912 Transcript_40460/m.91912 type:complete len:379 (-) Transcript_40460:87-1223(-)
MVAGGARTPNEAFACLFTSSGTRSSTNTPNLWRASCLIHGSEGAGAASPLRPLSALLFEPPRASGTNCLMMSANPSCSSGCANSPQGPSVKLAAMWAKEGCVTGCFGSLAGGSAATVASANAAAELFARLWAKSRSGVCEAAVASACSVALSNALSATDAIDSKVDGGTTIEYAGVLALATPLSKDCGCCCPCSEGVEPDAAALTTVLFTGACCCWEKEEIEAAVVFAVALSATEDEAVALAIALSKGGACCCCCCCKESDLKASAALADILSAEGIVGCCGNGWAEGANEELAEVPSTTLVLGSWIGTGAAASDGPSGLDGSSATADAELAPSAEELFGPAATPPASRGAPCAAALGTTVAAMMESLDPATGALGVT